MIFSTIANSSGASKILSGGIVSYQLLIKNQVLGIQQSVLEKDAVNKKNCTINGY